MVRLFASLGSTPPRLASAPDASLSGGPARLRNGGSGLSSPKATWIFSSAAPHAARIHPALPAYGRRQGAGRQGGSPGRAAVVTAASQAAGARVLEQRRAEWAWKALR